MTEQLSGGRLVISIFLSCSEAITGVPTVKYSGNYMTRKPDRRCPFQRGVIFTISSFPRLQVMRSPPLPVATVVSWSDAHSSLGQTKRIAGERRSYSDGSIFPTSTSGRGLAR